MPQVEQGSLEAAVVDALIDRGYERTEVEGALAGVDFWTTYGGPLLDRIEEELL